MDPVVGGRRYINWLSFILADRGMFRDDRRSCGSIIASSESDVDFAVTNLADLNGYWSLKVDVLGFPSVLSARTPPPIFVKERSRAAIVRL